MIVIETVIKDDEATVTVVVTIVNRIKSLDPLISRDKDCSHPQTILSS